MSLIEFLQEFNADINEDEKTHKFFLKIRAFPTMTILSQYEWSSAAVHVDKFYDDEEFSSLKQKKCYRDRDGVVEQCTEDISGVSHFYSKRKFTKDEFAKFQQDNNLTKKFLEYSFSRKTCKSLIGELEFEVFHDIVIAPLYYELLTWKIEIPFKTFEAVHHIVTTMNLPQHLLPVYKKFMYVMQVSPFVELLNELFEESLEHIDLSMKQKMRSKDVEEKAIDSQYYIWTFGQLVHFRLLCSEASVKRKNDMNEVYEKLAAMKAQVDRNIMNKQFGLHVVDDEDFCY